MVIHVYCRVVSELGHSHKNSISKGRKARLFDLWLMHLHDAAPDRHARRKHDARHWNSVSTTGGVYSLHGRTKMSTTSNHRNSHSRCDRKSLEEYARIGGHCLHHSLPFVYPSYHRSKFNLHRWQGTASSDHKHGECKSAFALHDSHLWSENLILTYGTWKHGHPWLRDDSHFTLPRQIEKLVFLPDSRFSGTLSLPRTQRIVWSQQYRQRGWDSGSYPLTACELRNYQFAGHLSTRTRARMSTVVTDRISFILTLRCSKCELWCTYIRKNS